MNKLKQKTAVHHDHVVRSTNHFCLVLNVVKYNVTNDKLVIIPLL